MAGQRLSVRNVRELLRQKWILGLGHRDVARALGVVSQTMRTVTATGPRSWPASYP